MRRQFLGRDVAREGAQHVVVERGARPARRNGKLDNIAVRLGIDVDPPPARQRLSGQEHHVEEELDAGILELDRLGAIRFRPDDLLLHADDTRGQKRPHLARRLDGTRRQAERDPEELQALRDLLGAARDQVHRLVVHAGGHVAHKLDTVVDGPDRSDQIVTQFRAQKLHHPQIDLRSFHPSYFSCRCIGSPKIIPDTYEVL